MIECDEKKIENYRQQRTQFQAVKQYFLVIAFSLPLANAFFSEGIQEIDEIGILSILQIGQTL